MIRKTALLLYTSEGRVKNDFYDVEIKEVETAPIKLFTLLLRSFATLI